MLYSGSECSIAVNGAALLPYKFNYFMCGDSRSHLRRWFDIDCSEVRIVAELIATLDYKLYPGVYNGLIDRRSYGVTQQLSIPKLPDPVIPHLTYKYRSYKTGIMKNYTTKLMYRATISGCAAQLAFYMGCRVLRLYGCSFINDKQHYFYEDDHSGKIYQSMVINMDKILTELRQLGVRIEVFGKSKLTAYDKQYLS